MLATPGRVFDGVLHSRVFGPRGCPIFAAQGLEPMSSARKMSLRDGSALLPIFAFETLGPLLACDASTSCW